MMQIRSRQPHPVLQHFHNNKTNRGGGRRRMIQGQIRATLGITRPNDGILSLSERPLVQGWIRNSNKKKRDF